MPRTRYSTSQNVLEFGIPVVAASPVLFVFPLSLVSIHLGAIQDVECNPEILSVYEDFISVHK